jgi:hypothetical protein
MRRIVVAMLVLAVGTMIALAHPGGLDANGGHYNRKTGEYHYHRQPAATPQPTARSTPPASQSVSTNQTQTIEKSFWLNTSSGVRHNKGCRWFGNTQGGRYCGPNEGRACGQCGG